MEIVMALATADSRFLLGGYTLTELAGVFAGFGTPIVVAAAAAYAALRNGGRTDRTENKRVDLNEFETFRETYAADMLAMREEVAEVKELVKRLGGLLRRTRAAFRSYIRRVHDDWGRKDHPPILDDDVQELLAEDDWNNTLGRAEISAAATEARAENDERDRDRA
jgi:hypothetical protein